MQKGSKNKIFHEPFAGTAAVSIELLQQPLLFDWQVRLSDMDGCLVGFWQAVLNNPEALIADIEKFEPTVEAFFDLRDKELLQPCEFLALHQMSYSGLGRKSQGPLGGRKQSGAYKVGDRWNPEGLVSRVRELNRLMAGRVQIEQADVFDILRRNEGGVWYLDPPYYEKGGALYEHSFGAEDHKRLRDALENCSGWMLSYDDHPEICKLYSGFHLENLNIKYTVNQGKEQKVNPTKDLLIGSSKDTWTPRIMLDKSKSAAADQADALLIKKINAALRAADEAQAEHVSRSKAVGLLLLEAKKLHPKVKDFEAYLERVDGLHLSRAYDLMKLAGGRTTDAELREEARKRKRKERAKPKPKPEPKDRTEPEPKAEPFRDVTEFTERRKTEYTQTPAAVSATNLREFEYACRTYLPMLNEADLTKARAFVTLEEWRPKAKKVA